MGGFWGGGALARALDERLASENTEGAPSDVHVGLSFAAKGGGYCRSFTLAAKEPLAGLACHGDAGWQVDLLTAASTGSSTDRTTDRTTYRQAASETSPEVLRAIDARMAGSALDAQGERAARAHGWR